MTVGLNIAYDATPLRPGRSGVGVYTENLVTGVAAADPGASLVLLSNAAIEMAGPPPPNIRIHRTHQVPLRSVWLQTVLPAALDAVEPDLCHFPNYLAPIATHRPYVVTVHDMSLFRYRGYFPWRKRYFSRGLMPQIARRAAAVITVSDFSRREILDVLDLPAHKVHVVPEAAPPAFGRPVSAAQRATVREHYRLPDRYILAVGTIEPRKNLGRLIAAYRALHRSDPKLRDLGLVLAGKRGWRHHEAMQPMSSAQGRVVELGYVPDDDLPALYAEAEVAAYPSLYEGFGLPILEAMSAGTPVLTSDTASMREVAGDAALLVNPVDTAEIFRGLAQLTNGNGLREELLGRGSERSARYTWHRAGAATLDVYHRAARTGRQRRAAAATPRAELAPAVHRALIYADLFDCPLTVEELRFDLAGVRATGEQIDACLDGELAAKVERRDGLTFLPGRGGLVAVRAEQSRATDALIEDHAEVLGQLAALPFVRMLAFSGGTSHKNSPGGHDIDLFIVTEKGRAWLTHAFVIALSRLYGRRRAICANYFVDTGHLRVPNRGDFFTGHQLIHLRAVKGADVLRNLFRVNDWVGELFPNAEPRSDERPWAVSSWATTLQSALERGGGRSWAVAEQAARLVLGWRLKSKRERAREAGHMILAPGLLKLHTNDNRRPIAERYRHRLEAEGLLGPEVAALLALGPRPR